jgi:hypothetical protein
LHSLCQRIVRVHQQFAEHHRAAGFEYPVDLFQGPDRIGDLADHGDHVAQIKDRVRFFKLINIGNPGMDILDAVLGSFDLHTFDHSGFNIDHDKLSLLSNSFGGRNGVCAAPWSDFQHFHPGLNTVPNGGLVRRLNVTPADRVVDQGGQCFRHREGIKVPDNAHQRM